MNASLSTASPRAQRAGLALLLALALALLVAGCDTLAAQEEFVQDANLPPSGYTQTDDDGNVVREDTDDWRSAPIYGARVLVEPAFPNPASASDFVNVELSVRDFDVVRSPLQLVAYRDGRRDLIVLDEIDDASFTGFFNFNFSAGLLGAPGLYRLFVLDGTNEIVSYGDLRIEG